MPETMSIEIVKHSNKDIRVIVKSAFKTVHASLDDLYLCQSLVIDAIDQAHIFYETKTFEEMMEENHEVVANPS